MGYRLSVIGLTPIFPIFYFPHFIFSFPPSRRFVPFAVKNSAAVLWINPASHPDPIRGQKCLERSGSGFPDFLLSRFHLSPPCLGRFCAFCAFCG